MSGIRGIHATALALVLASTASLPGCRVADKVQETVAYVYGMQEYVYGFPLVMMDVTRQVMTATATTGEYKAPINQFARLRAYVDPDFKDVVRISVNSLWSHGFVDLDAEPMIVSVPDMKGRYIVVQGLNMWTDDMLNLGRYGTDYRTRAYVAFMGLGALSSEDAVYPSAFVDGDGTALDGGSRYVMHFEKGGRPPSKVGVWSISPYRDNFYVRNAQGRYGLLSSMPLKYNADGSLDVYLQATSPGADKEANWLPIPPSGSFNLTVRAYQPMPPLLDGSYKLPPARRVRG